MRSFFPLMNGVMTAPGALPSLDSETGLWLLRKIWRRFNASIAAVLEVGQAEGVLEPGPTLPMVLALTGILDSVTKWIVYGEEKLGLEPSALVMKAFLRGFARREGDLSSKRHVTDEAWSFLSPEPPDATRAPSDEPAAVAEDGATAESNGSDSDASDSHECTASGMGRKRNLV